MKHLIIGPLVYFAVIGFFSGGVKPPDTHPQPKDNRIRSAVFLRAIDGDTAEFSIQINDSPSIALNRQKIRLKGVRCFENDPKKSTPDQLKIAIDEKAALNNALTTAREISIQLDNRQTYDRIEGVVWADGQNINDYMLQFPQGGN